MPSLEEREKALIDAEKKLNKKRIRDKIADIIMIILVLSITFYNTMIVNQANSYCDQQNQKSCLGINDKWNVTTNKTLQQAINRLTNITNKVG
jgi:hypothetical protein